MRGVISGGMLTGLHYLGLQNVFDVVYGASAGSINAGFFLTGQTAFGSTIYYEEINNRHFIDWRRYFLAKPVVSLEYLLDHVMVHERALDWKHLLSQPIPLRILALSVTKLATATLGNFVSREEVREAMRASARIPGFAGPPVSFRGDHYLDATLAEAIPFRSAVKEGCTHVLVLRTRPADTRVGKSSWLSRFVGARGLVRLNPAFPRLIRDRPQWYNDDCDLLEQKTTSPGAEGPHILSVAPSHSAIMSRMEKDRSALVRGSLDGATALIESLTGERPVTIEIIRPYSSDGSAIRPLGPKVINHSRSKDFRVRATLEGDSNDSEK